MDYLDRWNEEQRRVAQDWRRENHQVQQALAQIAVRASSRHGELSATVDAHGKVTDLRITPQALRLGEVQLRKALLQAIQRAQSDAQHQVDAITLPYTEEPARAAAMTFIRDILGPST
ncbi:YbaB/EbfC family nucleoid-associated protein [Nocardia sp. NPDC049220]|uniref:YbaB/EbfC family nucleoid-associated protein n=1 Tax=Nocardia sp. NPDC049220 TaxID=3155273 RepID=UPI0033DDB5CE